MAKTRALGKGLDALIPTNFNDSLDGESNQGIVNEILIDDIFPNVSQPRKQFDKNALNELENSIKKHGLIQPIIVRKTDSGYEIIAGERRWRASKNIGLKTLPVVVKEVSDSEQAQMALVENLQREDLSPIEEANGYKALMDDYGFTQTQLSDIVGYSRSNIANTLRLLNLSEDIQKMIADNKISGGHGRALLSIEDDTERSKVAKMIVQKNLSVRDVENLSAKLKKTNKSSKKSSKASNIKNHEILAIQSKLQDSLGTKVTIYHGNKKGKLEIEYYGEEDLERLLTFIKF